MNHLFNKQIQILFLDSSLPLLDPKFEVNETPVDINFVSDYFVYGSKSVQDEESCRMLCFFQSKCSFFFFRRSSSKNCFFGKYELHTTTSIDRYKYIMNKNFQEFRDYNSFRKRYGAPKEYEVTTPKPNSFNFKQTLIHLSTKDKNKNVTEAMIDGLKLGPTNPYRSAYYGHCSGAGIHFVTSKNWTLPFTLVYTQYKPCFFKILRLVEGTLKLSIPNFAVRFSLINLYPLH